jgi:hypothetical protein
MIMKKATLLLTAVMLSAVPAASADDIVRSFHQQIPTSAADKVHLDFPVGEVTVEAAEGSQMDVDVKIACESFTSRCEERAKEVRLVYNTSGDQVTVEVKNWPKVSGAKGLHVVATVKVPRSLSVNVELGVGELNVKGMEGDLTADLGVGEVNIRLPKEAVGSVDLDTGVGESSLVAAGRRYESAGLVSREIKWHKGTGRAEVSVDCGVGEIDVVLD